MGLARAMQRRRRMKFEELFERRQAGRLNQEDAARVPGISVRTFRRREGRYGSEGDDGLPDRRLDRVAGSRIPADTAAEVPELHDTMCRDCTAKRFREKLADEFGFGFGCSRLRVKLQDEGRTRKVRRRGAHRRKRPRKPMPGMMLHQDGSTHEWVPGKEWDLVRTMDDATSEAHSGFFVAEEGTTGSFRGLSETIDALSAAHLVLAKRDFEDFLFAAEVVLSEEDPALELPEKKRRAAELYGNGRNHSSTLRQSLCDTLVPLAVHGDALVGDRPGIDLEAGVNGVSGGVRSLLAAYNASVRRRRRTVCRSTPRLRRTFSRRHRGGPRKRGSNDRDALRACGLGNHWRLSACMLWALELLAWKPEQLVRVTSILAGLCAYNIDDNWANKPAGQPLARSRFRSRFRACLSMSAARPASAIWMATSGLHPSAAMERVQLEILRQPWASEGSEASGASSFFMLTIAILKPRFAALCQYRHGSGKVKSGERAFLAGGLRNP